MSILMLSSAQERTRTVASAAQVSGSVSQTCWRRRFHVVSTACKMLFVSDTQFESLVSHEHAAECAEEADVCLASQFDLAKPGTPVVFIAARLVAYLSKRGCGDVARDLQLVRNHPSSAHTITNCLDVSASLGLHERMLLSTTRVPVK